MRLIDAELMRYNITHDFDDDGNATLSSDEELTQKCLSINDVVNWLKLATTVDAEPVRHGYWVFKWNQYDKDGYIIRTRGECSCCNQYSDVLDYCGNCGAKMDGKE